MFVREDVEALLDMQRRSYALLRELVDPENMDGAVTLVAPPVRRGALLLGLATCDLGASALAEALELRFHLGPLGLPAGAGALQRVEHWTESELDLGRIDGLGLLAEELALEPLQLVGDEDVELAELVPLVLRALGADRYRRELCTQRFDLGVSRVALAHLPA